MSSLKLTLRQIQYTNRAFWRNPVSAFFTLAFPLMMLVFFTLLFGGGKISIVGQEMNKKTFYVPAILVFGVITACYTNICIGVAFARDSGVLKRIRGTPLPIWIYLMGWIGHAILVSLLLVVLCTGFGVAVFQVDIPHHFFAFFVSIAMGAFCFCSLGLATTSIVPNGDASPAVANGIMMPLLFVSDVFVPLDKPLYWLNVVSSMFPVRHFSHAIIASFFSSDVLGLRGLDLLVMGVWGLAGMLFTLRFFSWEPRH